MYQLYEKLILEEVDNYYLYAGASETKFEERLAETIDEDLATVAKDKLRIIAQGFVPSGEGYIKKEGVYVVRKDNERQKRIVARLEDYTCQICGFKCAYTKSNGRLGWIIEVDHIVDKADGGTEELHNLWALCPNCHTKKTRGIIVINTAARQVYENGQSLPVSDHHLGWARG